MRRLRRTALCLGLLLAAGCHIEDHTPTGSRRIAGVTRAVAPEPPAEMSPAMPLWRDTHASNASAIAATEAPRSPVNTPDDPRG